MGTEVIRHGKNISLIWTMILVGLELCLIWALASQFSYLVLVYGDASGIHYFVLFGIVISAGILAITLGVAGSRAHDKWGNEKCATLLGADTRLFQKSELYVFYCVILGTMVATGAWDLVTVLNALIDSTWDLSVFFDDYVVLDFIIFQIVWQLWLHALIGGITAGIGLTIAIYIMWKIGTDTFCEL